MTLNIKLKRSSTKDSAPSSAQLEDGELGVNYNKDSLRLYVKDSDGKIRTIAGKDSEGSYWNLSGTDLSPTDNTYGVNLGADNVRLFANGTGTFTGKVTSDSTIASDGATTLTTKDYVDAQVASADTLQEVTDNGNHTTNSIYIGGTDEASSVLQLESNGDVKGGDIDVSSAVSKNGYHLQEGGQLTLQAYSGDTQNMIAGYYRDGQTFSLLANGHAWFGGDAQLNKEGTKIQGNLTTVVSDGTNDVYRLYKKTGSTTSDELVAVKGNGDVLIGGTVVGLVGLDPKIKLENSTGSITAADGVITLGKNNSDFGTYANDGKTNNGIRFYYNETNSQLLLSSKNTGTTDLVRLGANFTLKGNGAITAAKGNFEVESLGTYNGVKVNIYRADAPANNNGVKDVIYAGIDATNVRAVLQSDGSLYLKDSAITSAAVDSNLKLKGDGSITAAGNVLCDVSGTSSAGLTTDNGVFSSNIGETASQTLFRGVSGSNSSAATYEKFKVDGAGNGTFKGNVTSGGSPGSGGQAGSLISKEGYVAVTNADKDATIWYGFTKNGEPGGSTATTSRIYANGSATFKNEVACGDVSSLATHALNAQNKSETIGAVWARNAATSGKGPCFQANNPSGTGTAFIYSDGSASFDGTVTATVVPPSDARFKENITPANPQLADVVALGGMLKNYDWNDDAPLNEEIRSQRQLGLIAQEVAEVCPSIVKDIHRTKIVEVTPAVTGPKGKVITEAVTQEVDDSYKGLSQDALIMKLIGAVAELTAEVNALKSA